MRSTLNPRLADDPHDFVVVPPDMVRVVPSDDELSHVLRDAARHLSEPQAHAEPGFAAEAPVPALDTTFRAAAVGDLLPGQRSPFGNWARRGLTAFAFAAITGAVGIAWQFYGAPAKQLIANWTPLTSSQASEEPPSSAPPAATEAAEAAAPDAAPAQAAPAAPTAAEAAATATAALSPDQAQSQLQSMARDLASAGQEIQELKASITELKAGQQQISRELAKAAERPRAPAPPPHAAAPARKPPPRQAAARMYPPAAAPYMPPPQAAAPPPGDPSVPRPPMPVR
jgi:hypothetical protein